MPLVVDTHAVSFRKVGGVQHRSLGAAFRRSAAGREAMAWPGWEQSGEKRLLIDIRFVFSRAYHHASQAQAANRKRGEKAGLAPWMPNTASVRIAPLGRRRAGRSDWLATTRDDRGHPPNLSCRPGPQGR